MQIETKSLKEESNVRKTYWCGRRDLNPGYQRTPHLLHVWEADVLPGWTTAANVSSMPIIQVLSIKTFLPFLIFFIIVLNRILKNLNNYLFIEKRKFMNTFLNRMIK